MFKYIDSLAAAHGLPLPHYCVDHQQSGCMLYMSSARLDLKGLFRNQLEEMVHHSTPVYIIKGCPPPSDRASMVTTLNVTFEHGSWNVDIQAYYHVPNGDIHCPKPWITGKVESLHPILVAID